MTQRAKYFTWVEKDLNMTERIYIPLLDEGIDVWRPIDAEKIGVDTYLIPATYNPQSQGETWQFPPGSIVACKPRKTSDGIILAAIQLLDSNRQAG
jgi:hypothetical protein